VLARKGFKDLSIFVILETDGTNFPGVLVTTSSRIEGEAGKFCHDFIIYMFYMMRSSSPVQQSSWNKQGQSQYAKYYNKGDERYSQHCPACFN